MAVAGRMAAGDSTHSGLFDMPERTPLLLIPGLLCDAALWRHQAENLRDVADVRIVDRHTRFRTISEIAEAVLSDAPERFALAGLSMGGYIAMEMALTRPERVERLALLDTSARVDPPAQLCRRMDLIDLARRGKLEEVARSLIPILVHPRRFEDGRLTAAIIDMAARVGVDGFIRQQQAIMSRPFQVPNLHRIKCPTCVVVGREDILTPPECAMELVSGIAGSKLVMIEDCGHLSTMESPENVTAALREWLVR